MADRYHIGRKTPAKGVHFSYGGPNILWTTICSKNRGEWLAQKSVVNSLHRIWLNDATAWLVGDYLIMPDHLHFFCAPHDLEFSIERWFSYWKDCFTKSHTNPDWEWLRGGYHYRMRTADQYTEKWHYMMNNPLRKNLVTRAEDWPWRGRVHDVRWT